MPRCAPRNSWGVIFMARLNMRLKCAALLKPAIKAIFAIGRWLIFLDMSQVFVFSRRLCQSTSENDVSRSLKIGAQIAIRNAAAIGNCCCRQIWIGEMRLDARKNIVQTSLAQGTRWHWVRRLRHPVS